MKLIDLAAQQTRIRADLEKRLLAVLDHGQYVNGPEIAELEETLARDSGARHAIACSSGTDALLMALMALDIGRGDAVFTTPFTFFGTVEAICLVGATPVFVDIDPATFNLDPNALERTLKALAENDLSFPAFKALRGRKGVIAKAVMPVDLFGLPADYDPIKRIAGQYGLAIIEDAAQAYGAGYKGKHTVTLGDIGCTSFFPAKPLGAYGDGGMCFTDQDHLAERLRSLRNHGEDRHHRYRNDRIGLNARLDTMQAAVLLAKHRIFAEECDQRVRVAARYHDLLSNHAHLKLPAVPDGRTSVWAQYSLLAESGNQREALIGRLSAERIPTAIYYPVPIHLQDAFGGHGYQRGDYPVSESCSRQIFSLPMHPYMAKSDQEKIADLIR
jgi:dTDP-4-amino-4,6-dideoxygalactose transaminase